MSDDLKTERSGYSPNDFLLWEQHGMLEISPKFQRRKVWTNPARSYFIDTLLRGMIVPPLYFRMTQNKDKTQFIREVIDGQQRVRSVLDFIAPEGYRLARTLDAPWKGKTFSQLSKDDRDKIMHFSFASETFHGISDKQVLEIFSRLNTYSIPLNDQELRNGQYYGVFKHVSYSLAFSYLTFWSNNRIFSDMQIARMLEVEMTSELLIAANVGMQDKKKSIDTFYEKWDTEFPSKEQNEKRFAETMQAISETFSGDELADSAFHRPPFLYTLYCVVFHRLFGMPGIQRTSPRKRLTSDDKSSLKDAAIRLSEILTKAKDQEYEVPKKYVAFVAASQRQTDNILPRKTRFNTLYGEAF